MNPQSIEWFNSGEKSHAAILVGGDFSINNRYEHKALAGEDIFDKNLQDATADKDLFIVNLESLLCDPALKPGIGLRADHALAAKLKSYNIDIVTLANNHLRDLGDEGVMQALTALKKNNVPYTGAGKNITEASRMLTVDVKGLKLGIWALAEKELNTADKKRPGTSVFDPEANASLIPELKAQVDFLLVIVHAGHEFILTPSPRIRSGYRHLINAGADIVIGHHPHVPQGIECYDGRWIVYSLGNMVFDHPYVASYPDTDHGYMVRLSITPHQVEQLEVIPYTLDKSIQLKQMNPAETAKYYTFLKDISSNIVDEAKFEREWEKNAAIRFQQDYNQVLHDFSRNYEAGGEGCFMRIQNLFGCPTHQEIIEKIAIMLGEGKLKQ